MLCSGSHSKARESFGVTATNPGTSASANACTLQLCVNCVSVQPAGRQIENENDGVPVQHSRTVLD